MKHLLEKLLLIQDDALCLVIKDGEVTFTAEGVGLRGEKFEAEFVQHEFLRESKTFNWFDEVYDYIEKHNVPDGYYPITK